MKLDRRGFVLSAASLAAFPWVRRAAIPAANAADMSLLFHGDFNVENFSITRVTVIHRICGWGSAAILPRYRLSKRAPGRNPRGSISIDGLRDL